jgi:hypothetical protein
MPPSLITLLVVALVCLLLGAVAGLLLSSNSGYQEEDADLIAEEAPPGGRKGRYSVMVRLWREKASGALVVELDGKAYLAPGPLRPDQRERLEHTAADLALWLGISSAEMPARPMPEMTTQAAVQAPPAQGEIAAVPPAPAEPAPKPDIHPPVVAPPPPVSTRSPKPAPPVNKEAPKTMVQQINAVLQEMIIGTPYEMRTLSLTEDPVRGVIVWLGSTHYEGIDGVPDPEVQAVLRAAVAEWERRQDEIIHRRKL